MGDNLAVKVTLLEEAITKRPFPQLAFMSENRFDSFLRDRGFHVGVDGIRSFAEAGLIARLGSQSGDFHPFQIWPISELFRRSKTNLDVGIRFRGLDPVGLKSYIDTSWALCAEELIEFPKSEFCLEFNQKLLPLFLWIESYFLPSVRGPRAGVVRVINPGGPSYTWNDWVDETDIRTWLCKHSVSDQYLSEWRFKMLLSAHEYDPARTLYLLLRSTSFEVRREFRGRLRLAHDLYELAEIGRLFLERVSEQPQRKEWDPRGHPNANWVERLYGCQPNFGAPEFLRPLVRHHGLDPAFRVRWLVEGETEAGFILRYAEQLGVNIRHFVTFRNFGGDGAFRKQLKAVDDELEAAREEQCFVTLTFDDSGRARKRVENLIANRLVNLRFVLNQPDFELENFRVDQLVAVAMAWASDSRFPIKLRRETLVQEVSRRISERKEGFKKAFNCVLHLRGEQFKLSKGTEWGSRLADHLINQGNLEAENGTYSDQTLTKIEQQIFVVLRGSQPHIDFPLSMERLDPRSLEIARPHPPAEI